MKFFGSVHFAIILIALTVIFVILGTFLESWSGSHLYAAAFTYGNPFFQLLLWLYFVNILLATLRRMPFKRHHIPFIITHLGLLMILAGLLVKSYFGVQGSLGIAEGSGSNQIILPNTFALLVEEKHKQHIFPLKKEIKTENLSIKLLEWHPHCEEKLEGFIKGDWGHLMGFPLLPVNGEPVKTPQYALQALQDVEINAIDYPGHAALIFLKDINCQQHLIAFSKTGKRFLHTFDHQEFLIFDKGFGGYGVFAELPSDFPQVELISPLTRKFTKLNPHRKTEELKPLITLYISQGNESEILSLGYDKYGTGFKWPALNGKYLLRFQSLEKTIPLRVRLRQARQVNYPQTTQPYSFESDLYIDGQEATISMNRVFEKKGYRFYLANLTSPPFGAKRAQIVVNYDPAKYFLTYPGAFILALGMFLLYFRRQYV